MKREKIDNHLEKRILTGLIISDKYLREVRHIYDPDLIEIPYVDIVAEWCFDYWQEYGRCPGRDIETLFYDKSASLNDETGQQIERFLSELSEDFDDKKFDPKYLLDLTVKRFRKQRLKYLAEDISTDIAQGRNAERHIQDLTLPSKNQDNSVEAFSNPEAIYQAFNDSKKPLLTFPGALGKFWNHEFVEEAFVSLCGPEKRGKTWWLMQIAMRASRARVDTAFFQVGDMSQNQMLRRMAIYLNKRSDRPWYCGEILVPMPDCEYNQSASCKYDPELGTSVMDWDEKDLEQLMEEFEEHEPCSKIGHCRHMKPTSWYTKIENEPINHQDAIVSMARWKKWMGKAQLRISTHANNSVCVADLENILDQWKDTEGFVPKVIIIDYADILAPEPGSREFRHQVNDTWKAMRRLSQERKCCVVTATQANAASYNQKSVGLSNFSEDKRKRSHVTVEFGLNQTPSEKRRGIMRIGQIVARESKSDDRKEVYVTQCLEMGRPFLKSWFV